MIFNFSNSAIQNFDKNLKFRSNIMSSGKSQSAVNNRSKKTFVQMRAFQMILLAIIVTFFDVLQITVNTESNFLNNVIIKFIAIVRKEIVKTVIDINFSYVTYFLIWLNSQLEHCLTYWQVFRENLNMKMMFINW